VNEIESGRLFGNLRAAADAAVKDE